MRSAAEWARRAADHDRGACRPHRAGASSEAQIARDLGYHAGLLSLAAHQGRERGRADRACARRSRAKSRWSASTCSPPSAASCCRSRSGAASRRSRTSSRSRSRRSTATARSTSCAAWSRPAPQDRVTLYTGNDDHIVLDLRHAVHRGGERPRGSRPCASRAGCSGTGAFGSKKAVELLERIHAAVAAGSDRAGPARARLAGDRLQRGDLRRRQRLPRRHRRLPRDPAPAGAARRHLVPRPERDARTGTDSRRSTASARPIRISTTTTSCAQPRALAGVNSSALDPSLAVPWRRNHLT